MSERISISSLRAAFGRKDVYLVGAPDDDLLALVEAVEAADRYATLELRACADPCECGSAECALVLALAPFVGGERQ